MSPVNKTLCVLFADVSGSTRLYERLGDTEALYAVERCLKRMERATVGYKGRVVKTIGDEIMAAFDAPEEAFQAACEMQQRVEDLPPVSGVKLTIRVGFHFGAALVEDDGDVFGDTVNTAARMVGLANPAQIITTGETADALPALLRQSTRDIDALSVKGKAEDVRVVEVIWQESDEMTMKSANIAPATPVKTWLKLNHGGREVIVDQDLPAVTLGRDSNSDIVIKDPRASRLHGRVERRRDKFVVIDQSTNGTYVNIDGEAEFVLKREEAILRGRGRLSFGHAHGEGAAEEVEFEVMH
jgi:adenylate cyclase